MTIHSGHPFDTPAERRDAARRLRGRLVSPVTLWLAGQGSQRAGLTVSSVVVALGDPARLVGLVDPDSELAERLSDTFTTVLLDDSDRALADAFAGLAPAPGGPFRLAPFAEGPWGPTLPGRTWAGLRTESSRLLGWSLEVVGRLEHVEFGTGMPLAHLRGGYRTL